MISHVKCIDVKAEQSLHNLHHTNERESLSALREYTNFHQATALKQPAVIIVALLVISLHAGLLILMLSPSTLKQQSMLTTPMIAGVLIQTPAAEPVKAPKKVARNQPKPVSKRLPVAKKAITLPPVKRKPPVPEVQETIETTEDNVENVQKPAPVVAPRVDATRKSNPAPVYPRTSLRRKETGKVILEVLIQIDGTVGEIRIKQSSGYKRLDRSAMKAVKRWRYIPAQQAGQAIDYWYQQPIVFSLRK